MSQTPLTSGKEKQSSIKILKEESTASITSSRISASRKKSRCTVFGCERKGEAAVLAGNGGHRLEERQSGWISLLLSLWIHLPQRLAEGGCHPIFVNTDYICYL